LTKGLYSSVMSEVCKWICSQNFVRD